MAVVAGVERTRGHGAGIDGECIGDCSSPIVAGKNKRTPRRQFIGKTSQVLDQPGRLIRIDTDRLERSVEAALIRRDEMELVGLNEVIHKTITVLQHQPIFHNITVEMELEEKLPPIYGNPIRLNQVVMNIIVNAAQAMEEDGGTMRVTMTDTSISDRQDDAYPGLVAGDYIRISVADTGKGIKMEDLPMIFEPYYTTKPVGEGTGLGLPISRRFVQLMGGDIGVESNPPPSPLPLGGGFCWFQ